MTPRHLATTMAEPRQGNTVEVGSLAASYDVSIPAQDTSSTS